MGIAFPTTYIRSCCNKTARFYHHHSDLISAYGRLALYTNVFAQKIFRGFPPRIAHLSQAGLSYTGVIYLNLSLRELRKGMHDLSTFYQHRKFIGMTLTAAKVAYQSIDILLVAGGFVVSVAAVLGYTHWMAAFYLAIRPLAVSSLALSAISQLTDYIVNRRLSKGTMPDRQLWVHAQLSPWDHQRLRDEPNLSLETLIDVKLTSARNRIGIMITDYVLLATCALHPNTAISAFLMLGRSIVAILMLHQEKFGQRTG